MRRQDHVGGAALEFVVGRELIVAFDALRERIDGLGQRAAAVERTIGELLDRREVSHLEVVRVRIAGFEGLVATAQIRAATELPGERRIARYRDVRRQRAFETGLVRDDCADRWPVSKRRAEATGHDPIRRGLMMVVVVRPGADERQLIHALRHLRQQLADQQAGHIRMDRRVLATNLIGGFRFQIERVVMR